MCIFFLYCAINLHCYVQGVIEKPHKFLSKINFEPFTVESILFAPICLANIVVCQSTQNTLCFKKKFTLLLFAITKSDVDRFQ